MPSVTTCRPAKRATHPIATTRASSTSSARGWDCPRSTSHRSGGRPSNRSRTLKTEPQYPYSTHLDVYYPHLAVVDVPALVSACTHAWYNQTLCRVNESVVRLGVVHGEYHWHKHDAADEFFYVVSGRCFIDLEGRTVELEPGQGFVVPKGVMHRPRAPGRTVILMVETAAIVPTGS